VEIIVTPVAVAVPTVVEAVTPPVELAQEKERRKKNN
jgi:hypothetical protein